MREYLQIVDTDPALIVSLDDAKEYCSADGTTDHDTIITNLIYAAATDVEEYLWHTLLTKTHKLYLSQWPSNMEICLRRGPVISVTSVSYYDSNNDLQAWDSSNYVTELNVEPAIVYMENGGPTLYDRPFPIVVEYEAGYGATDAAIPKWARNQVLRLVHWYYDTPMDTERRFPSDVKKSLFKYRRFRHDQP